MTKKELAEGIHQVEDKLVAEAGSVRQKEPGAYSQEEVGGCGSKEVGMAARKPHKLKFFSRRGVAAAAAMLAAVLILCVWSGGFGTEKDGDRNGTSGNHRTEDGYPNDETGSNGTTSSSDDSNGGVLDSLFGKKKGYQKKAVALAATPKGYSMDSVKFQQVLEEHPVEPSFYEALQDFTFRTASALAGEKEKKGKNLLYSPLSLYYALAVTTEGAAGETKEELRSLLAVSDTEDLAGQCANLYRRLYRSHQDGKLQIANSLWMAEECQGIPIHWQEEYLQTAAKDFYASLFSADFKEDTTYRNMGEWVSDQTAGLLKPDVTPSEEEREKRQEDGSEQILGILNTVYVKDRWLDGFYEEFTREEEFYLADGETVPASFMCKGDWGTFFEGEGFLRAELELEQVGSMVFVLPDEDISVEELLASPERLAEAFLGGEEWEGERIWRVPKFVSSNKQDWRELLEACGVKKAFQREEADFSRMVDQTDQRMEVWISQIEQGTKLIVEEGGIEAAAYTYVALSGDGREPIIEKSAEMILNRPFLYGIVQEDVYLFIGVCQNPAVEE